MPEPTKLDDDEGRMSVYRQESASLTSLVDARDKFNGDLDAYLVYLVLTLHSLSSAASLADRRHAGGMNALSLADVTGIPRETTRRKLKALQDSGHITRREDGLYYIEGSFKP